MVATNTLYSVEYECIISNALVKFWYPVVMLDTHRKPKVTSSYITFCKQVSFLACPWKNANVVEFF